MILREEPLPHLRCSAAVTSRGSWDEASEHGDASRIGGGGSGQLCTLGPVQAFVEQKNDGGARIVGYRRLEGLEAAAVLAELYRSVRLFVNHFQPSFKLATKSRDGAKVRNRYHSPATPYQWLLADARVPEEARTRLQAMHATLDRFGCCGRSAQHRRGWSRLRTGLSVWSSLRRRCRRCGNSWRGCAQLGRRAKST